MPTPTFWAVIIYKTLFYEKWNPYKPHKMFRCYKTFTPQDVCCGQWNSLSCVWKHFSAVCYYYKLQSIFTLRYWWVQEHNWLLSIMSNCVCGFYFLPNTFSNQTSHHKFIVSEFISFNNEKLNSLVLTGCKTEYYISSYLANQTTFTKRTSFTKHKNKTYIKGVSTVPNASSELNLQNTHCCDIYKTHILSSGQNTHTVLPRLTTTRLTVTHVADFGRVVPAHANLGAYCGVEYTAGIRNALLVLLTWQVQRWNK